MPNLSGKTPYDLEQEDFEELFCSRCIMVDCCDKETEDRLLCAGQIDCGEWDSVFRTQNYIPTY